MGYVTNPVRFAYNNYAADSGSTLSSTSEVTSLPWSNTKNPLVTKVGQSGSTDTLQLTWQLAGGAQNITMFALRNHNIPSGSTVTLKANSNSSFATPAVSVGLTLTTNPDPILYNWEPGDEQVYEYWQLEVVTPAAQATQIGHVYIGDFVDLDLPSQATSWTIVDPSQESRGVWGSKNSFIIDDFRAVAFQTSAMDQSDRRNLETVYKAVGTHTPLYIMFDRFNYRDVDGYHRLTMFCYFTNQTLEFPHIGTTWHGGPSMAVEEVRE